MYLREKDSDNGPTGSPYYIGKGKNRRATACHGKHIAIPKKENIRFIQENLSEDDAFMWEVFWIAEFGRVDLDSGCLRNRTDGGEAGLNKVVKSVNKNTRKKLSIATSGANNPMYGKEAWSKGQTKETNEIILQVSNKNKGKKAWNKGLTKETNQSVAKVSKKMSGRKVIFSDNHKKNLSESKKGSKNPNFGKEPWNKKKPIV